MKCRIDCPFFRSLLDEEDPSFGICDFNDEKGYYDDRDYFVKANTECMVIPEKPKLCSECIKSLVDEYCIFLDEDAEINGCGRFIDGDEVRLNGLMRRLMLKGYSITDIHNIADKEYEYVKPFFDKGIIKEGE